MVESHVPSSRCEASVAEDARQTRLEALPRAIRAEGHTRRAAGRAQVMWVSREVPFTATAPTVVTPVNTMVGDEKEVFTGEYRVT